MFAQDPETVAREAAISRLLLMLTIAKRPLRWFEIQAAFAFDADDEVATIDYTGRSIKDDPKVLCWSLVERHPDGSIDLVHPTAKDYVSSVKLKKKLPGIHDLTPKQIFDTQQPCSATKSRIGNGAAVLDVLEHPWLFDRRES